MDMTHIYLHKGDPLLFWLLMMDKSLDMSITSSVGTLHSAEKNESLIGIPAVLFSPMWDLYYWKISNLMLCQQLAECGYLYLPDLYSIMLHVHITQCDA